MLLEQPADLQRTFDRCLGAVVENQCHPIASSNLDQSACGFGPAEFLRAANDFIEGTEQSPLLVNQQFRVTDNVDEQDVRDFQRDFLFDLGGHSVRQRRPSEYQ